MAERRGLSVDRGGLVRLLGFVPQSGALALGAALNAVSGPAVSVRAAPDGAGIAALVQDEPAARLLGRSRAELLAGLHTVQRRLEVACIAGPFLPMDPSASCCPASALAAMLDPAWPALVALLARAGRHQQWDIVLRWQPEPVLAARRDEIAQAASGLGRAGLAEAVAGALRAERARREAALLGALTPVVLAVAPGGGGAETELAVTVLLGGEGEAVVEAALEGLAPEHVSGASIDMRGPLPPVSFAAVRVVAVDADAVARAWRLLDLPASADDPLLHLQWRRRAFALHPDRQSAAHAGPLATALSEATEAYHLLRDLVRDAAATDGARREWTLAALSGRAGHRLVLPRETHAGPEKLPAGPPPRTMAAALELQTLS